MMRDRFGDHLFLEVGLTVVFWNVREEQVMAY